MNWQRPTKYFATIAVGMLVRLYTVFFGP